ncbi:hypothetical protein [Caldalkalibacillus mannanilyticus]|uniref:hypothetical protein n=1 Tax=Caldalkalibacillus mannanilyticus TaxID=1418 RepID=UPI000468FAA3|nr:hypothetical protein [Caldalkalibacillus mannanilyticus]
MKPTYIFLVLLILLNVGCTNTNITYEEDELYLYSGEIISVTPQDGYVLENKSRTRFTLSLHGFRPEGEEFDAYNGKFSSVIERAIEITDNTKIYNEDGTEITPTELETGSTVEFKFVIVDEYHLEAIEIKVIEKATE